MKKPGESAEQAERALLTGIQTAVCPQQVANNRYFTSKRWIFNLMSVPTP